MLVIAVCAVLVVVGVVLIVRWGDRPRAEAPPRADSMPVSGTARLLAQRLVVLTGATLVAGLLMAGAGGRLVMRLLAVTAGDDAQGLVTEAQQRVGEISVGGTLSLVGFASAAGGMLSAAIYLLLRRWLPSGRAGGVALAALLLLVLSHTIEPLRRGNPDFDIVGPGWLSVLSFGLLAVGQGMLTAAVAERLIDVVPFWDGTLRTAAAYLPLLLLLPVGTIVFVPLAVAFAVGAPAARSPGIVAAFRSPRALLLGRVALVLLAVAFLPGFVSTVVDIIGRGNSPLTPSGR